MTLIDASGSVGLALFERPAPACRSSIALRASAGEFLAWRRHLAAAIGGSLEAVDHDLSGSIYFSGPDGNPFEITSYEYARVDTALYDARA